ncbi:hypothetical protein DM01DRAFT_1340076 [Hesseltinella vesiculosa]|uniref:Uncharacterized protein n=1 Tax=Hesseltinella vesiculosa TaxID=101127 RepID=A0A1X2G521_9FUNG|nr:hypothetical protein DM01DRAFT_1340076 [Hesseltinella vesiculosa]
MDASSSLPPAPTLYLDPHTMTELEALKGKLGSLQETLSTQIAYLKEPKFHFTWPDLLNKFNMLTAKFSSLSEDFYQQMQTGSTSTLPKLMLHPWHPPLTEQDTNIFSVLLRTKLIPDIEALEKDTIRAIQQTLPPSASGLPSTINTGPHHHHHDEPLPLDQWKSLRERHDRLAITAHRFIQQLATDHRDSFLERIEDDESEDEDTPEWKQQGFGTEDDWKRFKLECMMTFYSMGKDELVGSDLKSNKPFV